MGRPTVLFASSKGEAKLARTTGGEYRVDVAMFSPEGSHRARVSIKSPPNGPSLRLDGYLENDDLPLDAARELVVVPDHVWISAGAPIHVREADDQRLRVETSYTEGFDDLFVDTDCSAITLSWKGMVAHGSIPKGAQPHHLRIRTLALFDGPEGSLVRAIESHREGLPTLYVVEESGSYKRVIVEDWLRVAGWVRAIDLEAGEAADCDDCRGGILDAEDVCFGHPITDGDDDCDDHGERLVRVTSEGAVHARPSDDAPAIGWAEKGAILYLLEKDDGWGRIAPRSGVFAPDEPGYPPKTKNGFWIPLDSVEAE